MKDGAIHTADTQPTEDLPLHFFDLETRSSFAVRAGQVYCL